MFGLMDVIKMSELMEAVLFYGSRNFIGFLMELSWIPIHTFDQYQHRLLLNYFARPQITSSAALYHRNREGQRLIVCGFGFRKLTTMCATGITIPLKLLTLIASGILINK